MRDNRVLFRLGHRAALPVIVAGTLIMGALCASAVSDALAPPLRGALILVGLGVLAAALLGGFILACRAAARHR